MNLFRHVFRKIESVWSEKGQHNFQLSHVIKTKSNCMWYFVPNHVCACLCFCIRYCYQLYGLKDEVKPNNSVWHHSQGENSFKKLKVRCRSNNTYIACGVWTQVPYYSIENGQICSSSNYSMPVFGWNVGAVAIHINFFISVLLSLPFHFEWTNWSVGSLSIHKYFRNLNFSHFKHIVANGLVY